jgi:DNA-binding response OmpR family regulator
MASVLLVDDDATVTSLVSDYLKEVGFDVSCAACGAQGVTAAIRRRFDAIVLDVEMPGMGGMEVLRRLRHQVRTDSPVLMISGRDGLDEKIDFLKAGADGYLIKPFAALELKARLDALVRRSRAVSRPETLVVGDLVISIDVRQCTREGKRLALTTGTWDLLLSLARASPRVLSREELNQAVWAGKLVDYATLRTQLHNLRKSLDKPFSIDMLQTVVGAGYRLVPSPLAAKGR